MVTNIGATDRLGIPPEDMVQLGKLFCSNSAEPSDTNELVRNLSGTSDGFIGPASSTPVRDFKSSFKESLRYITNPKYGWCRNTVTYGGWYSQETTDGVPAYILDKRWWSLFTWLPTSVSDTGVFCEFHSAWVNTMTQVMPDDLTMMLEEQYRKMAEEDAAKKPEECTWTAEKEKEFRSKYEACLAAITPVYNPETELSEIGYAKHKGGTADFETLCLDAMKLVTPGYSDEAARSEEIAEQYPGAVMASSANPVIKLQKYLNLYLRKIPWNRWVQRHDFCTPASSTESFISWVKTGVYVVATPVAIIFRQAIKAVAIAAGRGLVEIILAPLDQLAKHISKWIDSFRRPPPAAPGGGGGSPAPAEAADNAGGEESRSVMLDPKTSKELVYLPEFRPFEPAYSTSWHAARSLDREIHEQPFYQLPTLPEMKKIAPVIPILIVGALISFLSGPRLAPARSTWGVTAGAYPEDEGVFKGFL